jgi:hypothetical protein
MTKDDYCYGVMLLREDGSSIGHVPVQADWEPALEWSHTVGIRLGRLPAVTSIGRAAIEPIWHLKLGAPYVTAFRAVILSNGKPEFACRIPLEYFRDLAQASSGPFVESGALRDGEIFKYLVTAHPAQGRSPASGTPAASGERPGDPTIEEVAQPLPLDPVPLADWLAGSVQCGKANPLDMPVFIPKRVLDETAELSRAAGSNEVGGCLIGHLHRDTKTTELAVEVTEQIPAPGRSELTRLTFTNEAWRAVRAAIELRRNGEIMVGWWHSHSFLKEACKKCENKGSCKTNAGFLSAEDINVHRTVYRRAFNVALVVAESPCVPLTWSLFGWRHGLVAARNFYVLDREPSATTAAAPTEPGGQADGTQP